MEVLVLDGKNYVKASKAARDLGYATDYVGQLCRSGKVDAHLIGRTWYVNQEELGTHRVEKKRMSRVKAREQAKRSIEEHRKKSAETQNNYRNIDIQYEEDPKELIPETRKLTIESLRYTRPADEESPDTYIENKGEKIVLSGELEVVDVTEAPVETDTIILTPSRIRKGSLEAPKKEASQVVTEDEEAVEVLPENTEATSLSFEEKLALRTESETTPEAGAEDTVVDSEDVPVQIPVMKSVVSYTPVVFLALLLIALVTATLPLSKELEYSTEYPNRIDTSYNFSIPETLEIISHKI